MTDKNETAKPAEKPATDERMARPDRDAPHNDRREGSDREFSNRDWETANAPTDPERRRLLREKMAQTLLPDLPKKAGWHRFWASTSHSTDTVERRLMMGYRVIQSDELVGQPGWSGGKFSVKDGGTTDGTVRCREMIALEIPEDEYQSIMREVHHDMPRDLVKDIYESLEQAGAEVKERGGRIELGEGFSEMIRHRRPQKQFE